MTRPAAPTESARSSDTADLPDPVDWSLASRVASRVASRTARPPRSKQPSSAQMDDLVARAEQLVGDHTGLRPPTPARAQVVGREEWIAANIESFRRLLTPVWHRFATSRTDEPGRLAGAMRSGPGAFAPKVAAVQMGTLLGWMSGRVLGQYDVLVAGDSPDSPDAPDDAVYLVGPNLASLEQTYAFSPDQFRLWVALHEVTHRAQFRGVPWMRDHYSGLIDEALVIAEPDPSALWSALRTAVTDRGASRAALRDGGAIAMFAPPAQRLTLNRIAGLMSLLEGHGDVTMDRAGAALLPDAARFSHVLRTRRATAAPITRMVQRLIGLEAKLDQYRAGEAFIAEVESARGTSVIDLCWRDPVNLPTLDEIRTPAVWLERMGLAGPVAAD